MRELTASNVAITDPEAVVSLLFGDSDEPLPVTASDSNLGSDVTVLTASLPPGIGSRRGVRVLVSRVGVAVSGSTSPAHSVTSAPALFSYHDPLAVFAEVRGSGALARVLVYLPLLPCHTHSVCSCVCRGGGVVATTIRCYACVGPLCKSMCPVCCVVAGGSP